ncbi:GIY-YIG nuclease family protein [Kozakia baliensis]|uniref:GIY-YIG nuclease family protein n=1 Tax=Kozakia baliensis TaxID=153496 RepID=UPI00345B7844
MPVYMIAPASCSAVKIGHSEKPFHRLTDLQISHWEKLSIIRLFEGGAAEEKLIHKKFSKFRIRKEWFSYCYEIALADIGLVEISSEKRPPDPERSRKALIQRGYDPKIWRQARRVWERSEEEQQRFPDFEKFYDYIFLTLSGNNFERVVTEHYEYAEDA